MAAPSSLPTADARELQADVMRRARDMLPALSARAEDAEAARRIPVETHRDFLDAGFYRIQQPARYGGLELDFGAQTELAVALAPGCASSAWIASIIACHSWIFGMFPPEAQDDVWGDDPEAIIASSFRPVSSRVERAAGGLRISGRWKFSSAVDYCGWAILAMDMDSGDGAPQPVYVLVRLADCRIEDTWFVTGLAGTASNDIVLDDCFVPDRWVAAVDALQGGPTPGSAVNPGYLYRLPQRATFSFNIIGTAIGAARGAMQALCAQIEGRTSMTRAKIAEQTSVQLRIAEAGAEIDAAYALMARNRDEIIRRGKADGEFSLEERARYRRDNSFAAMLCVRAVDRIYPVLGGSGIATGNAANRAWRDVHAVAQHIALSWDVQAVPFGALAAGLPCPDPHL